MTARKDWLKAVADDVRTLICGCKRGTNTLETSNADLIAAYIATKWNLRFLVKDEILRRQLNLCIGALFNAHSERLDCYEPCLKLGMFEQFTIDNFGMFWEDIYKLMFAFEKALERLIVNE